MGTKNDPGLFDCYSAALPDEEMFVVLARDPDFAAVVGYWTALRAKRILEGAVPMADRNLIREAETCAFKGEQWRAANLGKWRVKR